MKNATHIFVFFQRTERRFSLEHNPYNLNAATPPVTKLSTCRLQYGATYYPEQEYEGDDHARIRRDFINYHYRKNDYNTGTQLDVSNYSTLYPVVYFDLRAAKESVTGDEKNQVLHYRLDQTANADYTIYAAYLNEEEIVIKEIGNELVVA